MIGKAVRIFGREIDGMHTAAYILGVSALASSVLALLRDRLFAHTFGAGSELDVYFAAFRIPDLIFVLVASLFSAYALIPLLAKQNEDERKRYIDTIALGLMGVMIIVSAGAYMLTPFIMKMAFPHVTALRGDDVILLTRILLLQPILLGFSNILAAITQTQKRYVLYALAPVMYNLGIIGGLTVLYPMLGMSGLAWGVVIGAALHVLIQLPGVVGGGFFTRIPRFGDKRLFRETMLLSIPRTLALSTSQLVLASFLIIAGNLASGSIAVFTFAFNLQAVPLAVIGASYSVAAFPTLARMVSEGNLASFVAQVVTASRHILFWTIPAAALMIVLRAHLVRTVLGSGAFDWTDTRLTAASFAFFSISLAGSALSLLVIRAYYAAGRSYLPLVVSLSSGFFAVGLALFLVSSYAEGIVSFFLESLLRVEDVPGTVVLILPFVFALSTILSTIAFFILFEKHFGGLIQGVSRIFWESLTAAGLGAGAAYVVLMLLGGIGPATTLFSVIFHGTAAGLVGILGSAMVYWFFGSPELREAVSTIRRRPETVVPVQSAEETITT